MLLIRTETDLPGIAIFGLLSLAFWLIGGRDRLFAVAFAVLLLGFFVVSFRMGGDLLAADTLLAAGGFGLYFCGLLLGRTIIRRSITLHLLLSPEGDASVAAMQAEIGQRLADMTRYRLALAKDGSLVLTRFGKGVAGLTAAVYRLFGQDR